MEALDPRGFTTWFFHFTGGSGPFLESLLLG